MKYCFRCGKKIFEDAEICPHCGVRQVQPVTKNHRSPMAAFFLALLFPGCGHLYCNDITGAIVAVIVVFLLGSANGVLGLGAWIGQAIFAYILARDINEGRVKLQTRVIKGTRYEAPSKPKQDDKPKLNIEIEGKTYNKVDNE